MPPGPVKKLLFKINYVLLNFTDPGALINIDGLNDFGIKKEGWTDARIE